MGMAASQVYFMGLTHRLHDVENSAQSILTQKMMLATQKDELYEKYNDALSATKLQINYTNSDSSVTPVDATFNTLCKYTPQRMTQYALKDADSGKVYVDENTAQNYERFENDRYAFAYAMLGMGNNFGWPKNSDEGRYTMGDEVGIGISNQDYGDGQDSNGSYNLFMTDVERIVFDKYASDNDNKLQNQYDKMLEVCNDSESTTKEKRDALADFRKIFHDEYESEIYHYMRLNKNDNDNTELIPGASYDEEFPPDLPKNEFKFYLNLYDQISASGGCVEIDSRYSQGIDGNKWLNNMVASGNVLIDVFTNNKWQSSSVATSTNMNNISEVPDQTNLKKAEAEYEHELGLINRKDTKYDQELSKLETERTAISQQMESVKKVKQDNIERTFNTFS